MKALPVACRHSRQGSGEGGRPFLQPGDPERRIEKVYRGSVDALVDLLAIDAGVSMVATSGAPHRLSGF
jgi:hypothetical protein